MECLLRYYSFGCYGWIADSVRNGTGHLEIRDKTSDEILRFYSVHSFTILIKTESKSVLTLYDILS